MTTKQREKDNKKREHDHKNIEVRKTRPNEEISEPNIINADM
jgi:hypothetical protein